MRVLSLFSGAGGLDLGLVQAGNELIWANDIDRRYRAFEQGTYGLWRINPA